MQAGVKEKHCSDAVSLQQESQRQKRALKSHVSAATVCATKPAFFLYALKRKLQRLSGREGATWENPRTSTVDLDEEYRLNLLRFAPLLPRVIYCAPDFEEPQMFTYWHVILIIAVICCISNSVWRMTLAKLLLPWHVASVWKAEHLYLKVLEGSLSLFFYFCEFFML